MRGKVLGYDDLAGTGLISADDSTRYPFTRGDLQGGLRSIMPGADVDFEAVDGRATHIYRVGVPADSRNKIAAALLAFFLGGIGIHKFYLGKNNAGIIMLLGGTVGWITLGLIPGIIYLIAFIEFIIYLTKTDQQFYDDYVVGDKSWF